MILQVRYVVESNGKFTQSSKVKLIFRASDDGWSYKDFHDKCDNMGPTFCLIKTQKGRIAGGFTTQTWAKIGDSWVQDNEGYVFSVDKKQRYYLNDFEKGIYRALKTGFCFGEAILTLNGNMKEGTSFTSSNLESQFTVPPDEFGCSPLTGEKQHFECSEFEVYKFII